MKVFIIGPIAFGKETSDEQYQAFAAILKNYGIEPVHPFQLLDKDPKEPYKDAEILKTCIEHICKCDLVMTINNWHLQKIACRIITMATELEFEVIHEINLNKWLSKHGILK